MIDEEVYIHPTAHIHPSAIIGKGTKIWHEVQIREGAKVGKNCILGKSVYIGRKVIIGDNVKIENRASIFQGVKIEDYAFIGPHVVFTNDLRPRSFNEDWQIIPTYVKKGASIGANSTILCGITIGEYAMIGAGSVVTKNVPPHGLVYGNPAKLTGFVCKCGQKLEKKSETKSSVKMICKSCNEEFDIPKEYYSNLK